MEDKIHQAVNQRRKECGSTTIFLGTGWLFPNMCSRSVALERGPSGEEKKIEWEVLAYDTPLIALNQRRWRYIRGHCI